jgi:Predicted hydrolases or acyltransferases (alpha/beta hydrolase superfamily)
MEITVKGVSIYYEQYGDKGKPEVLLLHGWMCDTTLFAPIAKALCEKMHVTVIDFPGHGKSGRPPEPWGVPEYAEAAYEMMKQLQIAPCSIIGHSFGGRVAIWLCANRPQMVTKLIITGGAGLRKPQTEEAKKRSAQYEKLKKRYLWMKNTGLFGSLPDKLAKALREKYGSKDYNHLDDEMRKTFVKVINLDLRSLLPSIKAPTLLVWGDKDTETPVWMGETMVAEIPDAALIIFEGGSHYAYLEQWQRFTKIALHFFTEV